MGFDTCLLRLHTLLSSSLFSQFIFDRYQYIESTAYLQYSMKSTTHAPPPQITKSDSSAASLDLLSTDTEEGMQS